MFVDDNRGGGGEGGGRRGGIEGCAICLEPISGEAFLDQCFHVFCYHCILQWSEMVLAHPQSTSSRLQCLRCPLCKTHYTSIIHDLSGAKFQRHHFLTSSGTRFRGLDGHIQRQAVYARESGEAEQKSSGFNNLVPKPNRWLSLWVQRELQVVMQEEDVETVMQHVVGVVEAFNKRVGGVSTKRGTTTKDLDWHKTISAAVRPFIFEQAEKFADELRSFLLSGLDIAAYDHRSQLVATITGDLNRVQDADSQASSRDIPCNNTYDLYDEDVDEDGVAVMVGRSIEAENRTRGETPESMERHNPEEDTLAQDSTHSQRKLTEEKHKKKPISPPGYEDSVNNRNSRHRREVRKKRKRGRLPSTESARPLCSKSLGKKGEKISKGKDSEPPQGRTQTIHS